MGCALHDCYASREMSCCPDNFEWQNLENDQDNRDNDDEQNDLDHTVEMELNEILQFSNDVIRGLCSNDESTRKNASDAIIDWERKCLNLANDLDTLFDGRQDGRQTFFLCMIGNHCLIDLLTKVSNGDFVQVRPSMLKECCDKLARNSDIMKNVVIHSDDVGIDTTCLEMFFSNNYFCSYYNIKKEILTCLHECNLYDFLIEKVESIETPETETMQNLVSQDERIRIAAQKEILEWIEKCAEIGSNIDQLFHNLEFSSNVFLSVGESNFISSRIGNAEHILKWVEFNREWIKEKSTDIMYENVYNDEKLRNFLNDYIETKQQIFECLKRGR